MILVHYASSGPAFDEMRTARDQEWEDAIVALPNDETRHRIRAIRTSYLIESLKLTAFGWFLWIVCVARSRLQGHTNEHTQRLVENGRLLDMEARRARESETGGELMSVPA